MLSSVRSIICHEAQLVDSNNIWLMLFNQRLQLWDIKPLSAQVFWCNNNKWSIADFAFLQIANELKILLSADCLFRCAKILQALHQSLIAEVLCQCVKSEANCCFAHLPRIQENLFAFHPCLNKKIKHHPTFAFICSPNNQNQILWHPAMSDCIQFLNATADSKNASLIGSELKLCFALIRI